MDIIIITQNRERIIKTKHLCVLYKDIIEELHPHNYVILGEYSTDERAREVFEKIQSDIEWAIYSDTDFARYQKAIVIKMPKE